jgi:AraC-like DNA-binding protein
MITFLDIMNRDKRSRLAMKNPEVGQIIEHINKNFTDPALAMGNITSQVYLSPGYISRLFKEYTGTTIYNFLMQKRLEHAKELIKDGWMVTHACMECGFTDYTSFLKAFKKAYKMTPKDYQKEYTTKNIPGI